MARQTGTEMKKFNIEIKVSTDEKCSSECPNKQDGFCTLFLGYVEDGERVQQCIEAEMDGFNVEGDYDEVN